MTHVNYDNKLLSLPAELLQHVLTYLSPLDLVNVALTCRPLKVHSYDDQIWQPIINSNLPSPVTEPTPLQNFRDLYIAHHPHWFLPRFRLWFADSQPNGKLLIARYDPRRGCIEAHAMVAVRGHHTLEFWEKDREVIIHSFNPRVSLDMNQPVLKLDIDSPKTDDQADHNPSDRAYAPPSSYSKETLMETFAEAGLYGSFMLCRKLPNAAIGDNTAVWPPLRFPADARVRNDTQDGYKSAGHRPSRLDEVSTQNFRLRKWVEYTGRRSSPSLMSFTSPNGLSAALGLAGPYFAATMSSTNAGGMSIRMPEDVTTYSTLPEWCYTPTKQKPWQGVWCGDYSGHGCEFLIVTQPDKKDEQPLPDRMDWLREWFRGGRRGSQASSEGSFISAQEEVDYAEATTSAQAFEDYHRVFDSDEDIDQGEDVLGVRKILDRRTVQDVTDHDDEPTGRIEAIKLTGDPNIPRGEYTFIAPDIGPQGFMRVADEEIFKGARIVRSAGHIAGRGFQEGESHSCGMYQTLMLICCRPVHTFTADHDLARPARPVLGGLWTHLVLSARRLGGIDEDVMALYLNNHCSVP